MDTTNANEKRRKGLLVALAALLVCVLSVAGTIAYLQKNTDPVTNTFVAGSIGQLELYEHPFDPTTGKLDTTELVKSSEAPFNYQLTAGAQIPKDTYAEVSKLTVPAYVFVAVHEEGLTDLVTYNMADCWGTPLGTFTEGEDDVWTVYAYESIVPATGEDGIWSKALLASEHLFAASSFENVDPDADRSLDFAAYMCQAAGFSGAADAWAGVSDANGWPELTLIP